MVCKRLEGEGDHPRGISERSNKRRYTSEMDYVAAIDLRQSVSLQLKARLHRFGAARVSVNSR